MTSILVNFLQMQNIKLCSHVNGCWTRNIPCHQKLFLQIWPAVTPPSPWSNIISAPNVTYWTLLCPSLNGYLDLRMNPSSFAYLLCCRIECRLLLDNLPERHSLHNFKLLVSMPLNQRVPLTSIWQHLKLWWLSEGYEGILSELFYILSVCYLFNGQS